ncbi:hypothetical protein RHGRI_008574 [Rhododendron griersonianum]|uniref:non-specific serine/threonine protein kinase n=1 Tax=Rhododendron griersonianum TaxID=479676 RepID=A0AAV6L290_9ERIC|nr:hypothetical protein RHGRI_008574 [Rhododendron griersonianum]
MSAGAASLPHRLTNHTSFFGIKLWITILICTLLIIVLILVLLSLYFSFCRRRCKKPSRIHFTTQKSGISNNPHSSLSPLDRRLLSRNGREIELCIGQQERRNGPWPTPDLESVVSRYSCRASDAKLGYKWYTAREIEVATNGFADENVIGSGDFGIVYRGVLFDGMRVAVKKLLYDRHISETVELSGKAENFVAQVEAIGYARHRNLVKLLGYSTEGAFRMLVYEYVDNGNLSQWLHGCIRQLSPLTWKIRMNIIQATAKGLAYLHEDIEPKVVHQHIKSSNILLDHQWNPKISDLGVAQVLGSDWSHIATSPLGMSCYIAPEYTYTRVFDEKSDVYSFGILLMEIITGKTPVEDSSGTETQVYLIDWLKSMIAEKTYDKVVDPKMPHTPSLKELKRILLIALRCVDPDVEIRPRMGDVIHMLEPRDLLLTDISSFLKCRTVAVIIKLLALIPEGKAKN